MAVPVAIFVLNPFTLLPILLLEWISIWIFLKFFLRGEKIKKGSLLGTVLLANILSALPGFFMPVAEGMNLTFILAGFFLATLFIEWAIFAKRLKRVYQSGPSTRKISNSLSGLLASLIANSLSYGFLLFLLYRNR